MVVMRRICVGRAGALIAILCLVAACNQGGQVVSVDRKSAGIPDGKTAALDISASQDQNDPIYAETATRLRDHLSQELVSYHIFRSVGGASDPSDYRVNVTIEKVYVVPPAARAVTGILAGRNRIDVRVTVKNKVSQKVVSSFSATGFGSGLVVSETGYGLDNPLRQVVKQIIKTLF